MTEPNGTVLIVEDNLDNFLIYSLYLEQRGGYRVLRAADGQTGVAMAASEHPDLILMDVSLPIMDGWDATRAIKADPATAHIPVVALTAHAMVSDREKAAEVGCDDYVAKPAEPQTVLEVVRKFLKR